MVRTEAPPTHIPGAALYGIYVVSLAACLLGNLMIRIGADGGWLSQGAQTVIALVASIPLLIAAVAFWRLLRRDLDELLQRIVLEGLGTALVVYLPLAAVYVNLRTAGVGVPRLDAPDLLLIPALLVAMGIAVAWRRYQ
jgi:hypothetical protein